ncbi:MAG TPA: negative regulator of sigma-Y activity [Acholeplasmataceae bacterium]|nr:MAG: hypothetical protein A2013_01730 [Tenericutes bacterium GWE2_38_8]HBY66008.1 negative regulator of sigma-Y activity [Acholeplasmataceae bacterium]HCB67623.1 negative regulator of sigma-Y activity [Acholeplasmataceae bacterium]
MLTDLLKVIWPLLVLQFVMQVIALVNLYKREKVRFDNKWIWVAIIILFNILGPILYFAFRGPEDGNSSQD